MDWNKLTSITPIVISAAGFCVSLASLSISYLSFQRDRGRLDVSISVGELMDAATLQNRTRCIFIKVVNSGRRPVLLTSVGGDYRSKWWKSILNKLFIKTFIPTGYMWHGEKIAPLYLENNRQFRLLTEGQQSAVTASLEGDDLTNICSMFSESSSFWVTDTTGRKHRTPPSMLSKLKADLADLSQSSHG